MPNANLNEQWAGANGDWIVTVGLGFKWGLVNVYTRRKIPLPPIEGFDETDNALLFHEVGEEEEGVTLKLQKIVICKVPTADKGYEDFSLIAIFDHAIAVLNGIALYGWTILKNQFLGYYSTYSDAIMHEDLLFAVTASGTLYAWEPRSFGKFSSLCSVLA